MIVLDANVLIAFLDSTDPHHRSAVNLVQSRFADGFATSALTIAEALVHPARAGREDAAWTALRSVGVQVMPVSPDDALDLARVRAVHRIRMPDAVALLCAMTVGAELATFDEALRRAALVAGVPLARIPQ